MTNEWITCQVCGYSTTDERRMSVAEIDGEYVDLCSSCDMEGLETETE